MGAECRVPSAECRVPVPGPPAPGPLDAPAVSTPPPGPGRLSPPAALLPRHHRPLPPQQLREPSAGGGDHHPVRGAQDIAGVQVPDQSGRRRHRVAVRVVRRERGEVRGPVGRMGWRRWPGPARRPRGRPARPSAPPTAGAPPPPGQRTASPCVRRGPRRGSVAPSSRPRRTGRPGGTPSGSGSGPRGARCAGCGRRRWRTRRRTAAAPPSAPASPSGRTAPLPGSSCRCW